MARMDHVMQIGKPGEAPKIYLEDYAYTYLKRQQDGEKNKYYLYGEREGSRETEKLYIYGISDSSKEENTYFKDYYPLGFLKIREGEKFLVNRKGQEKPIFGFYVFYAPNQSMQEYLVDTSVGEKAEEKAGSKPIRQFSGKRLPIREKIVFTPPNLKMRKGKKGIDFSNLIFYAGCIAVLLLLGVAVSGGNGYHKLAAFKQMVIQTMSSLEEENQEEEFVVEEQRIGNEVTAAETAAQESNLTEDTAIPTAVAENQITLSDVGADTQTEETGEAAAQADLSGDGTAEAAQEVISDQVSTVEAITSDKQQEEAYESYIVKEGDTLAKICQARYGSTEKMGEICDYNNIANADYIAPGQKLYLP